MSYQQVASALNRVGLYESPARRFVVVSGVTALALWAIKPSSMFKYNETTKKYEGRPMACCGTQNPDAAKLSWEFASALVGAISVLAL